MGDLIEHYKHLAEEGALRGLSILRFRASIAKIVNGCRARTVLDFGCGAGDAYRQPHRLSRDWPTVRWYDVTLYDPAFAENAKPPRGEFDVVLCSDVLEHIPEAEVPAFLARLFSHARCHVWASVCCRPAKKAFPDGTNLHVTLQPLDWWREQFSAACRGTPWTLEESP